MSSRDIAVIGGGPAGLAAAIAAGRRGCSVTLFEAGTRVGDTIRPTGDGRCNIANARTDAGCYRNPGFVSGVFAAMGPDEALEFLSSTGLLLREEADGRLYPQTNKSTSVIDALRLAAWRAGVAEECGMRLTGLRSDGAGWLLSFGCGAGRRFDAVVLACGSSRLPDFLPGGVAVLPFEPMLAPMATSTRELRGLDKLRAKCALSVGGHTESGEVTFRSYGLSGIAAFNATRFAHPGDTVSLDFLPSCGRGDSLALLRCRLEQLRPQSWLDFGCGMLLPLLNRSLLRQAGLDPAREPTEGRLADFDRVLRGFQLRYRGIGDARLAQVHRGGVAVDGIDAARMGLKGLPGLYVAGEMVDVDGPCGGYNLHWAWTSGVVAGRAAADD